MPNINVKIHDKPDAAHRKLILDLLIKHNNAAVGDRLWENLFVAVEEDNKIIGGLWGRTSNLWLVIELMIIPKPYRGCGHGKKLMLTAEELAIDRGCQYSWLDSYSYQAPNFYKSLGYEPFGTLNNFPSGHNRIFMKKTLASNS